MHTFLNEIISLFLSCLACMVVQSGHPNFKIEQFINHNKYEAEIRRYVSSHMIYFAYINLKNSSKFNQ